MICAVSTSISFHRQKQSKMIRIDYTQSRLGGSMEVRIELEQARIVVSLSASKEERSSSMAKNGRIT